LLWSNEETNVPITKTSDQKGRVAVPLLLWVAGVPFTLVASTPGPCDIGDGE
jgi:hypothetical protein